MCNIQGVLEDQCSTSKCEMFCGGCNSWKFAVHVIARTGTLTTFCPAYFKSFGLYLCHPLNFDVIIYANLCSLEGLHFIRVGDCCLKCVFLENLFTYLLWEVMLYTITNSWARKKEITLPVSDFTPRKQFSFHSFLAKISGYLSHIMGNIFLWYITC